MYTWISLNSFSVALSGSTKLSSKSEWIHGIKSSWLVSHRTVAQAQMSLTTKSTFVALYHMTGSHRCSMCCYASRPQLSTVSVPQLRGVMDDDVISVFSPSKATNICSLSVSFPAPPATFTLLLFLQIRNQFQLYLLILSPSVLWYHERNNSWGNRKFQVAAFH